MKIQRLAWLTDIHLNFLHHSKVAKFCQRSVDLFPDAVLIDGDSSDASGISRHFEIMGRHLGCPVYSVLGNPGRYRSTVDGDFLLRHQHRHLKDPMEQ